MGHKHCNIWDFFDAPGANFHPLGAILPLWRIHSLVFALPPLHHYLNYIFSFRHVNSSICQMAHIPVRQAQACKHVWWTINTLLYIRSAGRIHLATKVCVYPLTTLSPSPSPAHCAHDRIPLTSWSKQVTASSAEQLNKVGSEAYPSGPFQSLSPVGPLGLVNAPAAIPVQNF